MKPLFYMNSLFCPNECDLKAKDRDKEWRKSDNGSYYYQLLPPGVPYPPGAERLYLLGRGGIKAEELANTMKKDCPGNHVAGYNVTSDERKWRDEPTCYQSEHWVFVTTARI